MDNSKNFRIIFVGMFTHKKTPERHVLQFPAFWRSGVSHVLDVLCVQDLVIF
jgi:hypothetical protein